MNNEAAKLANEQEAIMRALMLWGWPNGGERLNSR
jgi:hypothetical protein